MDAQQQRLESLVRRHGRAAWAVAWSLLRNHEDAHDAVQQACLVAARKVRSLPRDDPWPGFAVVVAHEARNLRRKRRPLTNARLEAGAMTLREPAGATTEPSHRAERREEVRLVQTALDGLQPAERDAIALTHLAGMTHALAAQALDVPRQTLSARVQRGLADLGQRLDRKPGAVAGALGLVPMVPPTTGWEAAVAGWTHTATASLATASLATSATAATSALGGATLMSSKTLLVLTLSAAVGMGFLGGH